MLVCYVDETGDSAPLSSPTADIQPVIVIAGLILNQKTLASVTPDLLYLKRRFFPAREPSRFLDWMQVEVKGREIRRMVASPRRREHTDATGFVDQLVALLENHEASLIGRVWVKQIGTAVNDRALYTSSIQAICTYFQNFLSGRDETGIVIIDSREKMQNVKVVEAIFTQKFRAAGDAYPRILEVVTFGHGRSHGGIQLADLLCSALLFPMAVNAYCQGYVTNDHVRPEYQILRRQYGKRLDALQYRYKDTTGKWRGGITVCDPHAGRSAHELFEPPA